MDAVTAAIRFASISLQPLLGYEALTPSTFTSPFPFTPGVSTICHEHGSREEEKNNITKMPHHVIPYAPTIISPSTLHINLSPRRRNGLSYGFSLSGEQEVCGRPKTLVQPRYFVFYSSFFFLFLSLGCREGEIPVQVDITITHTRSSYIVSPLHAYVFLPSCFERRQPRHVFHLCRDFHVCLCRVFHACLCPFMFVSILP
jgi:hypothetical protein